MDQQSPDPSDNIDSDVTALFEAVRAGDVAAVTEFLTRGDVTVESVNEKQDTPLQTAVRHGHADVVTLLCDTFHACVDGYGSEGGDDGSVGITPLMYAVTRQDTHIATLLIRRGANVNACDLVNFHSVLSYAAAADGAQADMVELLLTHGADPNVENVTGETPLHDAAFAGHDAVCATLLEHGARVNVVDEYGHTPLHVAATSACVALLCACGGDVTLRDAEGNTPLHYHTGYVHGREECVAALLEGGAHVNAVNARGDTPLMCAARVGNTRVVSMLLAHGADVTARNAGGRHVLHAAAGSGEVDTVRALLAHGCHATLTDADGNTPLHAAARAWHAATCAVLLAHGGVDVNARNAQRSTPLHVAVCGGTATDRKETRAAVDVLNTLLDAGARMEDVCGLHGGTPLLLAAGWGHAAAVEVLLARGANIEARPLHAAAVEAAAAAAAAAAAHNVHVDPSPTPAGCALTPLMAAAGAGHVHIVTHLLARGARVDARTPSGRTALFFASARGRASVLPHLVAAAAAAAAAGCDDVDVHGLSPLMIATLEGHEACVCFLVQECGANVHVRTPQGETLRDVAGRKGFTRIAELLEGVHPM